jgi:myo-inositol catabolism protein IolC
VQRKEFLFIIESQKNQDSTRPCRKKIKEFFLFIIESQKNQDSTRPCRKKIKEFFYLLLKAKKIKIPPVHVERR